MAWNDDYNRRRRLCRRHRCAHTEDDILCEDEWWWGNAHIYTYLYVIPFDFVAEPVVRWEGDR